jgi:hypothetical protein
VHFPIPQPPQSHVSTRQAPFFILPDKQQRRKDKRKTEQENGMILETLTSKKDGTLTSFFDAKV